MAQHSIGKTNERSHVTSQASSLYALLRLRLACGLTTLLGAIITYFALSWDIQWHAFVGRDRTLTPPHVFLLSGIVVCSIGALVAVLVETQWVKSNQAIKQRSTIFANRFAAPLGIYMSGYAALNMAVAFPVDQYWHTLYGIEVTLWAPFHIMVISGLGFMALGAVYTFVSVAKLATSLHANPQKRAAYSGAVVAMATALATLSLLTVEGIDPNMFIQLGFTSIDLFPVLQGLLLGALLVASVYALPWRWAATSVVGVVMLFMGINQLVMPPALIWLMQAEQLPFLPVVLASVPPSISVMTFSWPAITLVSAILVDMVIRRARKQTISQLQSGLILGGAVLIGCFPFTLEKPLASVHTLTNLNMLGIVLTLALTFPAIHVGIQLGQKIGKAMSVSER